MDFSQRPWFAGTTWLTVPDLVERLCVIDVAPRDYGTLHRFSRYVAEMQRLPLDELSTRADAEELFELARDVGAVEALREQQNRLPSVDAAKAAKHVGHCQQEAPGVRIGGCLVRLAMKVGRGRPPFRSRSDTR